MSRPLPGMHSQTFFHVSVQLPAEILNTELFWNIESAGTQPTVEDPNNFLESYMNTKITCQQDGSYNLKFPCKENHPPLPTYYNVHNRST